MSMNSVEAFEFSRSTLSEERLRVEPSPGYTGAQILELLQAGRVQVVGETLLLALEPDSCEEGQLVVGKVLIHETFTHPKPWRKLGVGKAHRRQSRREDRQSTHEAKPQATLLPKQPTSPDFLVAQASRLRLSAHRLLETSSPDTKTARTVLEAARKLLQSANELGAFEAATLESIWLQATEALLADKLGDVQSAISLLYMAGLDAAMDLGCDHPSTLVLHGTCAQYKLEHGDATAKEELTRVVRKLQRATPTINCSADWIAKNRTEFQATLDKADELITQYNAKINPVEETPPAAPGQCCSQLTPQTAASGAKPAVVKTPAIEPIRLSLDPEKSAAVRQSSLQAIAGPRPGSSRHVCCRDPNWKRPAGSVWLDTNADKLPPQEWCACNGTGMVAHHVDYEGLMRRLNALQIDPSSVVVTFNEKPSS